MLPSNKLPIFILAFRKDDCAGICCIIAEKVVGDLEWVLSNAVGVDIKTIDAWIGVLEASFIAYRLQPYAANLSKRLTKIPKLYFYDTGILCYLLNIRTKRELAASHFYGSIVEDLVLGELTKHQTNTGEQPRLYFIRDLR